MFLKNQVERTNRPSAKEKIEKPKGLINSTQEATLASMPLPTAQQPCITGIARDIINRAPDLGLLFFVSNTEKSNTQKYYVICQMTWNHEWSWTIAQTIWTLSFTYF